MIVECFDIVCNVENIEVFFFKSLIYLMLLMMWLDLNCSIVFNGIYFILKILYD